MRFQDIPTPETDEYLYANPTVPIKGRTLFQHAQNLERHLAREGQFINDMADQVVAVEDALGFGSEDIPDADKHRLVMERIRDLIAAEGELGDLRESCKALTMVFDSWLGSELHPLLRAAFEGFKKAVNPDKP